MTTELQQFKKEVFAVISNLDAIKKANGSIPIMSQLSDYSVDVCECAAAITGINKGIVLTLMNKKHRDAAIIYGYEQAIKTA
jgi:hypothetical protein